MNYYFPVVPSSQNSESNALEDLSSVLFFIGKDLADKIFYLRKAKAKYTGFEFCVHFWSNHYFTGIDLEVSVNRCLNSSSGHFMMVTQLSTDRQSYSMLKSCFSRVIVFDNRIFDKCNKLNFRPYSLNDLWIMKLSSIDLVQEKSCLVFFNEIMKRSLVK